MIYMVEQRSHSEEIIIWEEGKQPIHLDQRPLAFIDEWCKSHGSTYQGRREACCYHLQIKQKVPILISEHTKEIIFPTRSVRDPACIWIAYGTIQHVERKDKGTLVVFRNGEQRCIPCDIRIIRREMKLCAMYLEFLTLLA